MRMPCAGGGWPTWRVCAISTLRRSTSAQPQPPPAAPGGPPARPAYVPPGPAEVLSPAKVVGLWLRGEGPDKQYFMFKQAGPQLLGLGCGLCDDPNYMAPLDRISIDGTTLRFISSTRTMRRPSTTRDRSATTSTPRSRGTSCACRWCPVTRPPVSPRSNSRCSDRSRSPEAQPPHGLRHSRLVAMSAPSASASSFAQAMSA